MSNHKVRTTRFTLLEILILSAATFLLISGAIHEFTPYQLDYITDYKNWYNTKFEWTNGNYMIVILFLYFAASKRGK